MDMIMMDKGRVETLATSADNCAGTSDSGAGG